MFTLDVLKNINDCSVNICFMKNVFVFHETHINFIKDFMNLAHVSLNLIQVRLKKCPS